MWLSICVRTCPASCLTNTNLSIKRGVGGWGVQHKVLPVEGECVCSHHVHHLPVTLPYAPAVGLLIMSACDSRTAGVVRARRLGSRGEGGRTLSFSSVSVLELGKEGNSICYLCLISLRREKWLFDFSEFITQCDETQAEYVLPHLFCYLIAHTQLIGFLATVVQVKPLSTAQYQLKWDTIVNQVFQSRAIFYSFVDSLTWLCAAIFTSILMWSPV